MLSCDFLHTSPSIYDYSIIFRLGQRLIIFFDSGRNTPLDLALSLCLLASLPVSFYPSPSCSSLKKQITLSNQPPLQSHTCSFSSAVLPGRWDFSIAQLCKQESGVQFTVPGAWVAEQGHPCNCTIMGIQDGREGSHKITRKNRGRRHAGKPLSNESRQKPKGLLT